MVVSKEFGKNKINIKTRMMRKLREGKKGMARNRQEKREREREREKQGVL